MAPTTLPLPPTRARRCGPETPDEALHAVLIDELSGLRQAMLAAEQRLAPWIAAVHPAHADSARNLAHYLALRRVDLRRLQERLAWIGLSSLGRSESHVLASLDRVLDILRLLAGRPRPASATGEPHGYRHGRALLEHNAEALFGPAPAQRAVRIMVTLPAQAAADDALVRTLVAGGMDVARINCAHDGPVQWVAMAQRVRQAAQQAGRVIRILMDLGGPKLRTGPIEPGPAVLKLKPVRDALGQPVEPAFVGLRAAGTATAIAGAALHLGVEPDWLAGLRPGDRIDFCDARGARRSLKVLAQQGGGVLADCDHTAYITPDTRLRLRGHAQPHGSRVADVPALPGELTLHRGDTLRLLRGGTGHAAVPGRRGRAARAASVACTLQQALDAVSRGERIWFDDGRIGAVVRRKGAHGVDLQVTEARDSGETLRADKGINLPDTRLDLPALTAKDLDDLQVAATTADMIGLSFAQSAADVRQLRERLLQLDAGHLGVVLKIETRRGFEALPEMLMAAMEGPCAGVMIARGDLAVECGYERMAEVQEEILWACEAAHLPVVWATQVLETLARTGLPSRAEITDAAMGGRAECVMLNKGAHIADAMRTLDDILRRMQSHQAKKRPLLRALKAWGMLGEQPKAARR
jgi:pyruvate kinase